MYNYAASVVFGVLTIVLVFVTGVVDGDVSRVTACTVASAMAWVSCYLAYINDASGTLRPLLTTLSVMFTVMAVATIVYAVWLT